VREPGRGAVEDRRPDDVARRPAVERLGAGTPMRDDTLDVGADDRGACRRRKRIERLRRRGGAL